MSTIPAPQTTQERTTMTINPNDNYSKLISDHRESEMEIPSGNYVKHPIIRQEIAKVHARQKRRMERKPGKAKPIEEIPAGGLLIDKHDKYYREQTPTTGVNAYYGKWPGDESEAELLDALKDKPDVVFNDAPRFKPVETPVHDPVKLKLKRIEAVPYRPDWRDVTIALLVVACCFLLVVVWL